MTNLFLNNQFLNEINEEQTYNRKNKIKGIAVVLDKLALQENLYQMGKVFDHDGTYTSHKTHQYTQEVYKLLV